MIIPARDSGFDLDANDASENAKNLSSSCLMGLILMVTSLYFSAICSVLLAAVKVEIFALLICDCRWLSELDKSGLV